jgi:OmpA-OmpF porin, OOP family
MHRKLSIAVLAILVGAVVESGCATKKYVRNQVAERVTPLENRTSELEETSRRNTQDISQLNTQLSDVRGRADKAQQTAEHAAAAAEQANTRISSVETSIDDLRANLDKYSLRNTAMVFFGLGSDRLTKEAMAQLDELASQITDRNGFVLEITGFGDSVRPTPYNQNLAQLRAEAVQRYLADKRNIPIMRMYTIGFGAARLPNENVPVADSSGASETITPGERAQLRRVDIRLLTNGIVSNTRARTGQASVSGQSQEQSPSRR